MCIFIHINLISSDLQTRFLTVPFKPISSNNFEDVVVFLSSRVINYVNFDTAA